MRVLLDTDVVLDLLLDRAPFIDAASALWELNEQGRFEAYISAITPINVFYIARKIKSSDVARQAVNELLAAMRVCRLDHDIMQRALTLPFADYEDAVQHESAKASQLDAIVTRNIDDYRSATLPVLSPTDFLSQLKS